MTAWTSLAPIAAIAVSAILVFVLLRFPRLLQDRPNVRSLHASPIPRTGGIAIVLGAIGMWLSVIPSGRLLGLTAAILAAISILDDWKGLHPLPRFSAHIAIAAYFAYYGLGRPPLVECIFLVLAIVWVTNLFNFMDGADGLAAGMAIGGFCAYAIAAWIAGQIDLMLICVVIAASTVPFLVANFHPARLFMGDSGSITLGFLAASIGALGWSEGAWSPFFPVFVFSPFIADASLTLLHRAVTGQQFWRPHRDHYYQKLIRMGLGHRNTALAEYCVIILSGAFGLASLAFDGAQQLGMIVIWGAVLVILAVWIDRRWDRHIRTTTL